jgi:hypothetical protein
VTKKTKIPHKPKGRNEGYHFGRGSLAIQTINAQSTSGIKHQDFQSRSWSKRPSTALPSNKSVISQIKPSAVSVRPESK